jgi:deoxyribose-phosphate aldolase
VGVKNAIRWSLKNKHFQMNIASFIDHTALKPTTTLQQVENLCSEALQYGFAAVCVPPYYVAESARMLKKTDVKVATVIGFPFGYNHTKIKVAETERALADGGDEVDMVMNIAALKNGAYEYLTKEVTSVLSVVRSHNKVLKVIIESGILTDDEIRMCCELYGKADVDFVKTSTGYADKSATVEAVQLMRLHLPSHIKIKASGGIKTFEFASALIRAGANRLGCSASVDIVKGAIENKASLS